MAEDNKNYQTTQTFLIECSRADSLVDTKEDADYNAKWTNNTNFNLKRGDLVSVEMATLSAKNSSGQGVIEFTGDKVFVDGTEKPYCDNKVLLEVQFYMNNNNTYSVGLPYISPEGAFNGSAFNAVSNVIRENGSNNYYGNFPCSFLANGYLMHRIVAGAVVEDLDPSTAYGVNQYNIGTVAAPNLVTNVPQLAAGTPFIQFDLTNVIAAPPDPNPLGVLGCDQQGIRTAQDNQTPNIQCNVEYGSQFAFKDSNGNLIKTEAKCIGITFVGPNSERLRVTLDQPVVANIQGNLIQGNMVGIIPNERDGSTEMGNFCPDNMNQVGMVQGGGYFKHGRILYQNMQCIGKPQAGVGGMAGISPNTTYGAPTQNGNCTTAYDFDNNKQGFRNGNIRRDCDGKPYIFTRNDYFGLGTQRRNNEGFFPKLMPLTAFILLEADELFTDLNSLANKINDKLHEALSPFDTDIPIQDNFITDEVNYPNPNFKSSSILPVRNTYGYYPSSIYENATYSWKQPYSATWTDILPCKFGGCTKIQPANLQPGFNFPTIGLGRYGEDTDNAPDLFRQYGTYTSLQLEWSYYKDGRICNQLYGNMGYENMYKMMFGDRLMRLDVYRMNEVVSNGTPPNQTDGIRDIGRAVIINTKFKYNIVLNNVPTAQNYIINTELIKYFMINTNMKFPTYTLDPATGIKTLNYDKQKFIDLAEQLREYELYLNKETTAGATYEEQRADYNGWCVDVDLGVTNDNDSAIVQGKTNNLSPMQPNWMVRYPTAADGGQYGSGLTNIGAPAPGARELISPAYSNAMFGSFEQDFDWDITWNAYKGLGRIYVHSRHDPNWAKTTKQFSDQVGGQTDTLNELLTNPDDWLIAPNTYLDIDLLAELDLPFVPAKYTPESASPDGTEFYTLAWRCFNDYNVNFNVSVTSTWDVGCITWGLPIGVSNSFMDNAAIMPMNGDQCKATRKIKNLNSGSEIDIYRSYAQNQTNFVVMGANNPTFQYNQSKNRFEFVNLQTDNYLSSLNGSTANAPATNPQLGEKCGIVLGQQKDAVYNKPNPKTGATSAENYTDPMQNQGIRAEIGGVSIFKVWLCPPDYSPPENINIVNYWDNSTLDATENNRQEIIKGCTKADDNNWEGCLLDRLGFAIEDLIPRYGRQFNRFSPDTYNNPNVNTIGQGTKPLILNNSVDGVINPSLNLYHKVPAPGQGDVPNGVPKFLHGFNENQEVIVAIQSLPLTAKNSPELTNSSFFLIYSDIVAERNYQSGATPLPCIFYAMKNYSNGGYLYTYGSNYSIMVNQDRNLSCINTEIRNPNDGRLAKLSKNSTIIYKVQRQSIVPNPNIDVFGHNDAQQPKPDPNLQELQEILQEEDRIAQGLGIAGKVSLAVPTASANTARMRKIINNNIQNSNVRTATTGTQDSAGMEQAERQAMAGEDTNALREEDIEPVGKLFEEVEQEAEKSAGKKGDIPSGLLQTTLEAIFQGQINRLPILSRTDRQRLGAREINQPGFVPARSYRRATDAIRDIGLRMYNENYVDQINELWAESEGNPEEFTEMIIDKFVMDFNVGVRGQSLGGPQRPLRDFTEPIVMVNSDILRGFTDRLVSFAVRGEGEMRDEDVNRELIMLQTFLRNEMNAGNAYMQVPIFEDPDARRNPDARPDYYEMRNLNDGEIVRRSEIIMYNPQRELEAVVSGQYEADPRQYQELPYTRSATTQVQEATRSSRGQPVASGRMPEREGQSMATSSSSSGAQEQTQRRQSQTEPSGQPKDVETTKK